MSIKQSFLKVIKYFAVFAYYPTSEEIYTFLQAKISKNSLEKELEKFTDKKVIKKYPRYTLGEYSTLGQKSKIKSQNLNSKVKSNNVTIEQWNNLNKRKKTSQSKLNSAKFKLYIKLLSYFPQIRLIGLSGSISMMNASKDDDIDLFIITAKNRLFTGRMIALLSAQLIGLRRSRIARSQNFLAPVGTLPAGGGESQVAKNFDSSLPLNNDFRNKVCLNLFFDESNLKVPKFKQTEFVGHEVLQMKPIIIKGDVYKRFLESNKWVFRLFPNAKDLVLSSKYQVLSIKRSIFLNT